MVRRASRGSFERHLRKSRLVCESTLEGDFLSPTRPPVSQRLVRQVADCVNVIGYGTLPKVFILRISRYTHLLRDFLALDRIRTHTLEVGCVYILLHQSHFGIPPAL